MKIIATHINADFDGFAAMIGLLKLHPDAELVFPGSKETALREFLRESGIELPERSVRDVKEVKHLILVDASREDRLGDLAQVLKQEPRPFVEIYDHHPREQGTIPADVAHYHPYGATTTIVVMELMKSRPALTSLEASILLGGIYEDTASFLSSGTTVEDFRAALYLMEQGAEMQLASKLLTNRLLPAQVDFFNALVVHCETHNIQGNWVTLSVFPWNEFLPDAAVLVHRLMELEPIDVFFALVLMDGRVHLIARSRTPGVDVGKIAADMGGGGHPVAASAVLKGVTLIEAREHLLSVLSGALVPLEKAGDVMKGSIITIEASCGISEASEKMNSFRINALPVTEGRGIVGTITRQIVDGAIFHGLQDHIVRDFMTTEVPLVDPETPLADVFDRMVTGRSRFVLVGTDPTHVDGIITRMDLLRYHYELSQHSMNLRKGRLSENLTSMLKKRLPQRVLDLLAESGTIAEKLGYKIYLVGGMVRDLLLHRDNMDLDLVVEGDGIRFAEEFGRAFGCEVAAHSRFGTARMIFPDRFKLDVATARTESYHAPAALPMVQGGILRQDLYRRDFTINTLAIDLAPGNFGSLVDYFGGWDDIHQGVIRVLHSLSFIDDPTRTLRAIRFATRFNFQISHDTKRLLSGAVESRILDKLSGKRFWTELRNVLTEEHPIPAVRMLHHYKLLQFIHAGIQLDGFLLNLLYQIENVTAWFRLNFPDEQAPGWKLYLMALLEKLTRPERLVVAQAFQLTADVQDLLRYYKSSTRDIFARLRGTSVTSSLYFSLREYPLEILLYAMARIEEQAHKQQIALFLRDLRKTRLEINGDDVIAAGAPRGPRVKEILDQVMRQHLDGAAAGRDAQLGLASRLVSEG
ncbi:MAG TPA: CBS domain-containing protein [Acidobacteriota bacterium]|nr:CBS domain-containing protein [Acidobacteriota bacterium]